MNKLTINVYDDDENIIKTCEAAPIKIKFGVVRHLMNLLKIDDIEDTAELLRVISAAWEQVVNILNKCFPDMEDDDWDNVDLGELIPVVIQIVKMSFLKLQTIPGDSKNVPAV